MGLNVTLLSCLWTLRRYLPIPPGFLPTIFIAMQVQHSFPCDRAELDWQLCTYEVKNTHTYMHIFYWLYVLVVPHFQYGHHFIPIIVVVGKKRRTLVGPR